MSSDSIGLWMSNDNSENRLPDLCCILFLFIKNASSRTENPMKKPARYLWNMIVSLLLIVLLYSYLPTKKSDQTYSVNCTISRLQSWANMILGYVDADADLPSDKASTEEIIGFWKNTGLVLDKDDLIIRKDCWGNDFNWQINNSNEKTILRIISCGKDGVFQNGDADDIYLEIIKYKDRKAQSRVKKPSG